MAYLNRWISQNRRIADYLSLILTVLVGWSASWFLYSSLLAHQEAQRQQQLYAIGQSVLTQVDLQVARRVEIIRGTSLMVAAQNKLDGGEFVRYVRNALNEPSNLHFIEWMVRVPQADLADFEAEAQANGRPDFRVMQLQGSQEQPVTARPEYMPLLYVWPQSDLPTHQPGLDSAQDPVVQNIQARARDSGEVIVSPSYELMPAGQGRAIMFSVAVYQDALLDSLAARRQALRGYVSGQVWLAELLKSAAFVANGAQLDLLVIDRDEPGQTVIFAARGEPQKNAIDPYQPRPQDMIMTVDIGSRPWDLVLQPRPGFYLAQSSQVGSWTLGGGMLATVLVAATLALTQRGRRQLEVIQAATHAAELALAQERQRLANIIEGTHAGTWEWQVQSGEVKINARCAEMLGYTLDEMNRLQLKDWEALINAEDLPCALALVARHFAGTLDYYECEHRMRHKDGYWIWMLSRGKLASRDARGKPLWMAGTYLDISERKVLDELKSEFVSTVSHELRTPLTAIRGGLGLVVGGALGQVPDKVRHILDIAYKNVQRLALLVDDLLDMEKLLAGKMQFNMRQHAIMPLVEQALESVAAYGKQYQVQFVLQQRADDLQVEVDEARLQQVLCNFLSNAAKFSPADGQVWVRVFALAQDGKPMLRIEVEDQGDGIPLQFHARIFQKFAQADSSDTRQKGGTGLGLAISKELIERMHGKVGFCSPEGKGATFFLELPLAPVAQMS
ncbi:MAG: hypothetical protein RL748_704 [Pseudomonadota bacterium]|jgi:PAS domain S-box-containing protein